MEANYGCMPERLIPDLYEKVLKVIDLSRAFNIEMRLYFTIRDPFTQANLWGRS
jgi:hypothetical protein